MDEFIFKTFIENTKNNNILSFEDEVIDQNIVW